MIRPLSQFGPALLAFALTLAAGGCATQKAPPPSVGRPVVATQPAPAATEAPADLSLPGSEPPPERRVDFYPGNDRLLDTAAFGRGKATRTGEGTIGLDFERASLREVVKVILGDVLKQNYVIEPGMEGMVTMHTSQPIGEDALIPTLETVLAANGAAMVRMREGVYRIGPRDKVKGSAPTTAMDRLPQGYSVRIVPLDYIGAVEMQNILKPIAPADGILRVDATRNLLVLAGTG
ncbi:MAG: type II secretion system protein GspD, partial [Ectothiorhodospiraceae bacterium]|nr:type II secretion system protein GspD [Ectothiorhodospiraceae bacterium]